VEHIASMLLGLGNGGVYAALALALVLTYRSSGVINFATGAIALFAAYTYAGLRNGQLIVLIPGLPTSVDVGGPMGFVPAAAIALALTALLGALLYAVVFRPLREAPPLARAVASLGVLIVIQTVMVIRSGTLPANVTDIFPVERWEWRSLIVLSDRLYLALTVVALAVVLAAVYRFTRFGLETRAAAETQVGAFVSGVSPDRVALLNWMVSAAVAGAAGILIAPLSPVTPISYTLFVVPALAAAVVGGFQHLVPTVAAGILIGMLQAEAVTLAVDHEWLPDSGMAELVPLVVILVALLVTGRSIPVRGGPVRQPLPRAPRPRGLATPTLVGTAVGVLALVLTDTTWRSAVIASFIFAIISLSLVVVTGFAGQVSLAQLALAGTAAFMLSYFTESWGLPFPLAPLLASLVTTFVGLLIALPALRLRGLTLGIVTLAFAYAIEAVWFRNTEIVSSAGAKVSPPELFGIDLGIGSGAAFPRIEFGLLCLAVLVAVSWSIARLRQSPLGSAMLAVRANERAAAGLGVNVTVVKVLSFAIASFIAGLGGSLLAYRLGLVSFDRFTAIGGLTLLSTAYLAGISSVYGGVLAGVLSASGIVYFATERWIDLGKWFPVISGIGVIVTVIANPDGLAAGGHALIERIRHRGQAAPAAPTEEAGVAALPADAAAPDAIRPADGPADLEVSGLSVRYGGVLAVDDVSLEVRRATVVGLIGPNGAGKSSVIDAVTGFAPSGGTVRLAGQPIDTLAPYARVRRGLGRTFQALDLLDDLTVEENISVAVAGVSRDQRAAAVAGAMQAVGIAALAEREAGGLSQGERQLVSIARACAAEPSVLLLDEPAAGLDTTESQWLGERIRAIAEGGTAVLLVDHDVALVLAVCDHIYVLDLGRVIAAGDPATIRADRLVAEAYLGSVSEPPADDASQPPADDATGVS
jgi:ABC-type branched-subunit amino acid transport system ATPase component/branched-subunit amino acid ABC-type transport system permease component